MTTFLKKLNPLKIIIYWIVGAFLFTVIVMISLGISSPGGEQKPLIFLVEMIRIVAYTVLFLSISTIPFFSVWIKKYWYINGIFIVLATWLIYIDWKGKQQSQTLYLERGSSKITLTVNGKVYEKKVEYYDDFEKIKSISFTHNNKKDSIWTTFSDDGRIIKQEQYKNDSLIKIMK